MVRAAGGAQQASFKFVHRIYNLAPTSAPTSSRIARQQLNQFLHPQQNGPALIPAGGKLGVTSASTSASLNRSVIGSWLHQPCTVEKSTNKEELRAEDILQQLGQVRHERGHYPYRGLFQGTLLHGQAPARCALHGARGELELLEQYYESILALANDSDLQSMAAPLSARELAICRLTKQQSSPSELLDDTTDKME